MSSAERPTTRSRNDSAVRSLPRTPACAGMRRGVVRTTPIGTTLRVSWTSSCSPPWPFRRGVLSRRGSGGSAEETVRVRYFVSAIADGPSSPPHPHLAGRASGVGIGDQVDQLRIEHRAGSLRLKRLTRGLAATHRTAGDPAVGASQAPARCANGIWMTLNPVMRECVIAKSNPLLATRSMEKEGHVSGGLLAVGNLS